MNDFADAARRSRARKAGATNLAPAGGDFASAAAKSKQRQQPSVAPPIEGEHYGPLNPHPATLQMAAEMEGNEAAWRKPAEAYAHLNTGGNQREDGGYSGSASATATDLRMQQLRQQYDGDARGNVGVDERYRGLDEFNRAHPISNYGAGARQGLAGVGTTILGGTFPEYADRLQQTVLASTGESSGVAGTLGKGTGVLIGLIPAMFGGAPAMAAQGFASGFGGSRIQTMIARKTDYRDDDKVWHPAREIGFGREMAAAVMHGTVEAASGLISGVLAKELAYGLQIAAPQIRAAMRYGGKDAASTLYKNLFRSGIKFLGGSGLEFVEEAATQGASNFITSMMNIGDPAYDEGVLEAGLWGAALHGPLGAVGYAHLSHRLGAASTGSPAIPGTQPPMPPLIADPSQEGLGQHPVNVGRLRPNGLAHEQTKQMYVDGQAEIAHNRSDRVIKRAAEGNSEVANALYKGMNMAPPTTGESASSDLIVRRATEAKTKAKPKTLVSTKTETAVALALRKADPNLNVEDAKTRAKSIVASVAKKTVHNMTDEQALLHHGREVAKAMAERRPVNKAVQAEYAPAPTGSQPEVTTTNATMNTNEMTESEIETWDNDAWGDDPVIFGQEGDIVDTRDPTQAPDHPSQSGKWTVGVDPDRFNEVMYFPSLDQSIPDTDENAWEKREGDEGEMPRHETQQRDVYNILDENGDDIIGPFDTKAEADFELQHIQDNNPPNDHVSDRMDGWDPASGNPPPKPPDDGGPADANPDQPMPGSRNWARDGLVYAGNQTEDLITPVASRIRRINKFLYGRLMRMEMMTGLTTVSDIRKVRGFIKAKNFAIMGRWWNMLSPTAAARKGRETLLAHDRAIMNGDWKTANRILWDNAPRGKDGKVDAAAARQLIRGQRNVRKVLADLHMRQRLAGIPVGSVEDYFPRAIKSYKKYKRHMGEKIPNMLEKKIAAAEKKATDPLTDEQKAMIVNEHYAGYGEQFRARSVSHTAQRTVDEVLAENQHLYERSDVALHQYISRANEAIQVAKFLGKGRNDTKESIGAFVAEEMAKGRLTADQAEEVGMLIQARLVGGQRSPNKFVRFIRDTGYITVLANPFSAITQIGDVGLSLLSNGLIPTSVGIYKTLTMKGMKQAEIGITSATAEFGKPHGLRNALDWALYGSGFKLADGFGKRVNMNAALFKFRSEANGQDADTAKWKKFKEEWEPVLGMDEFQITVNDLKAGVVSESVKMMIFAQLSKTQPISLSEMPLKYLQNPNGRLLYMLRSFTLKQLDFARTTTIDNVFKADATGNSRLLIKSMRNLVAFMAVFFMAGFSMDIIKDMLQGKDITAALLEEEALDNIWKIIALSKYSANAVADDGLYTAALEYIAPPARWMDNLSQDVMDVLNPEEEFEFKSLRNLPIVGALFDYGTLGNEGGKSARRVEKKNKSRAKAAAVSAYEDKNVNSAKAIIGLYNERRPEGMKKLTFASVRSQVRSKATKIRKEEREARNE